MSKKPKRLPYGAKNSKGRSWCPKCDMELIPHYKTDNTKAKERQNAKRRIRKEET
jgi:hypothetical protein